MTIQKRLTPEQESAAASKQIGVCADKKLSGLNLSHLGLRHLPNNVRKLTWLKALFLNRNELTELPEWIDELTQLNYLSLVDNKLASLPAGLVRLKKLTHLFLENNHLLRIPAEVLALDDAERIVDYYFRIIWDGEPLNEFKLILVGRGGVGKTTLVHRLVTDKYTEFKRTPGIKITTWPLQINDDDVKAHIWDFGGQEIMHGTHRFFMTERALYLVFTSGREGTEDHDAEYWLSLVRSFAGHVPVIVLLNKWDDYSFELNRELLREKYGRQLVFLETDSLTGTGISALREEISHLAGKLPGLKAAWPAEWRRIKEELPAKKKSWLTFEDFREFCNERGITKARDQEALAESLHDLGLMLSFRKDEALRDVGVLNPQWITRGIYQILNSRRMREAQGKFTAATFAEVLPKAIYPPALHPFLLALMRKFRLCHPLDDKGEKYLTPELLTKEGPNLEAEFPPEKCLGFVYRYESVLPEGLFPRFIVETYVHREPKYVWRTGVVLERSNCRALVRGDVQGRTVAIRVEGVGNGRRELLGIIREHFERIHRSFEKLPVTELIPIPYHPEVIVPYQELLDYEAAGDDEYKVVIDRMPVKLSVTELLDGIDVPGARRPVDRMIPFQRERIPARDSQSLFISYAHKDERFRDEFRGALTAYERKGDVTVWDDTCIVPGQKWEPEILGKLDRADIIVLLLSNDFIRSDYCYLKEMRLALERDAAGECAIVPVVVRACAFQKLELGQIQAIIPDGKSIKEHKDRDAAWLEVTNELERVMTQLSKRRAA
jgi:internalin A